LVLGAAKQVISVNEIQRQAYLSAMGIDSYMPRWILPGAPVPAACEFVGPAVQTQLVAQSPAAQVADVAADKPAVAAKTQSVVAATDMLNELDKAPARPAPEVPAQVEATAGSPAADTAVAPFALSVWRVSEALMVIDSRQVQLALPTDRLLGNMLLALGYKLSSLPKAEVVRWPFYENKMAGQAAGTETEVREMLHAFLDAHLVLDPVQHLLLMGQDAARYILPVDIDLENLPLEGIELKELATTAVVTPSLAEMLQTPELKADAWRVIQPLRQQPAD